MFSIPYFDLNTDQGKQQFVSYIVNLIRKEIISYSPSYITSATSGGDYVYQNTDFIQFNTNLLQAITPNVGQLNWNDTSGTLEFGLKGGNVVLEIGQEQVALVKHADNTGLDKGKAVYVVGSDGANKTVRYAQANAEATSSKTFGVMAESVTGGNKGFVATHGLVTDIDTSALTEGAAVWLSPSVAGGLTTTKPSAPNHLVLIGFCVRSHANVGKIFVHVVNGFELDELHNVKITSPVDEEVIRYDAAQGLWVNGEAGGSIDVSDSAPVGPATGDLWYNSSNGRTYIRYDSFWVEIGNTGDATSSHASTHITGAADVIDGDRLNISYVPTGYTRNASALGATNVEDLTAHLAGIDAGKLSLTGGTMTGAINSASTLNLATGGINRVNINSSGHVNIPNQPRFFVVNEGGSSITATNKHTWNGAPINVNNCWSTVNNRFTAPVAGDYFFSYSILNGASSPMYIEFRKNGVALGTGTYPRGYTQTLYSPNTASGIVPLNANDYIEIWVTGGTAHSYHSFFTGYLLA